MPPSDPVANDTPQDATVKRWEQDGYASASAEVLMVRPDGNIVGVKSDGSSDLITVVADVLRRLGAPAPAIRHFDPEGVELP